MSGSPGRRPVPALLLAVIASSQASADALSDPPAAWHDRIPPVAEVDVASAEQGARQAIVEARAKVDALLRAQDGDPRQIADAGARLCALYQLAAIDGAATECWNTVSAVEPDDYRWHYYAGYLALTLGRSDAALERLRAARALNPAYAPIDLRIGQVLLDTNALDAAQAALEQAGATPGLRGAALYYLGQIDLLRRDYAGAERHLTAALKLNPDDAAIHYPLAQVYRQLGNEALAREHLAQFRSGTPAADDPLVAELNQVRTPAKLEFREAMVAVRAQDYPSAIAHFEKGLGSDPDNLAARVSYARALFLAGQADPARAQLETVVGRDPDHLLGNLFLGMLEQSRGETARAAARYRHVLELEPDNDSAHFFLANLLFENKRYAEAASHYEAALKANDAIPPARLLELVALHRAGRSDRAVAHLLESRSEAHPAQIELQYASILLRALSTDADVRDTTRARAMADALAATQPMPPIVEAQALAAAAAGDFDAAVRLQQGLLDRLTWFATPEQLQAMRDTLDLYKQGRLPARDVWPESNPLLGAGDFDANAQFRDYPVAKPY